MSEESMGEGVAAEESVAAESQESSNEVEVQAEPVVAESKPEFKKELQTAIAKGASEKEVKDMIKDFELKVNGKTIKKRVNLSDEASLIREFQIAEANKSGMQKASEIEKAYASEMEKLRANPFEYLQALGLDPDQLAEGRIQSKIEELKKSPEQVEQEKLQKELTSAREELKRQKEESEKIKFEKIQETEAVKLDNEITDALKAHKTLPKTRKTVSRIADAMIWAMENGFQNVSVKDVLPSVEAEMKAELNELMGEMPDEILESYLGKKVIDRMRQKRLNSVKAPPSTISDIKSTSTITPKVETDDERKLRLVRQKEFFKNLK